MTDDLKQLCERFEHFETDAWAVDAILRVELLTPFVVDPCAGTGIMTRAARRAGYSVQALDIHNWGQNYPIHNWLEHSEQIAQMVRGNSVFINPPFTKSEDFIKQAVAYDARKIVCFQKFSWYEGEKDKGKKRGQFWDDYPPSRIYVCGSRATCWRHDVPAAERVDAKGNPKTTPTTYAWFVWEEGQPAGTLIGRLYKPGAGREVQQP